MLAIPECTHYVCTQLGSYEASPGKTNNLTTMLTTCPMCVVGLRPSTQLHQMTGDVGVNNMGTLCRKVQNTCGWYEPAVLFA